MTEETPFNPCSRKGEIRAQIATTLLNEIQAGSLTALIARAPDFYGPATPTGVANVLVFDAWAKNQKASWLVNDAVPHSLIYTPDAARAVLTLAESDSAWNQTWHLPTTPNPPTGREFITLAAQAMNVATEIPRPLAAHDPHPTAGSSPSSASSTRCSTRTTAPTSSIPRNTRAPSPSPARPTPKASAPPPPRTANPRSSQPRCHQPLPQRRVPRHVHARPRHRQRPVDHRLVRIRRHAVRRELRLMIHRRQRVDPDHRVNRRHRPRHIPHVRRPRRPRLPLARYSETCRPSASEFAR